MIVRKKQGIIPYIPKKPKEEVVEKKEDFVEYNSIEDAIENIPDFENTEPTKKAEDNELSHEEHKEEEIVIKSDGVELEPIVHEQNNPITQEDYIKYRVFEATDGILLWWIIDLPHQWETISIKDREIYVSSVIKTDDWYTIVSTNNILQIKKYK